jgi:putative ABC transport system substrate-binding protein
MYRIGWLAEGEPLSESTPLNWPSPLGAAVHRFVERLAELGYVEGRTLHWEYRRATAPDQIAAYAAELVERGVDLIVVTAAPAAQRAAVLAPGDTPVVASIVGDPVAAGYARSLAQPGGKLTGVSFAGISTAKRLEVFKETLPALTRLGVLLDVGEENTSREGARGNLTPIAHQLGMELIFEELRELGELDGALTALAHAGAEGVWPWTRLRWTSGEAMVRIVGDTLRHRLPVNGASRPWWEAGALVAYNVDLVALAGRHAELVDKVLRGTRPGQVPIEDPARYELLINLNTARALGLTVPPAVIARAREVIQ